MKYLLYLLIYATCGSTTDSIFYNKITSKRSNCYIVINVVSSNYYLGKAVVSNQALFQYFNEKEGFNQDQYREFVIAVLTQNSTIKMDSTDFQKFDFEKIKEVYKVVEHSKQGVDHFLNYYFNTIDDQRMLSISNTNMNNSEQAVIIKMLFDWKIPAFTDDETGFLMIIRPK